MNERCLACDAPLTVHILFSQQSMWQEKLWQEKLYCENCRRLQRPTVDLQSSRCDYCGLTYRGFLCYGQLGCANCYQTFSARLEKFLLANNKTSCLNSSLVPAAPSSIAVARSQELSEWLLRSTESSTGSSMKNSTERREKGNWRAQEKAGHGSIYYFTPGRTKNLSLYEPAGYNRQPSHFAEAAAQESVRPLPGQSAVILSLRLRMARNVSGLPYIALLTARQRYLLAKALFSSTAVLAHSLQHKAPQGSDRRLYSGDEDHLRAEWVIAWQGEKNGLESVRKCFQEAEILDKLYHWQYSYKYGYLTACPAISGSAMRLSFRLTTPALQAMGGLKIWISQLNRLGYEVRGFEGEGSSVQEGLQVSNGYLPFSIDREKELRSLFMLLKRLELAEYRARGN